MTTYRTIIEDAREEHGSLSLALGALGVKVGLQDRARRSIYDHFQLGGKVVNLFDNSGKKVATLERVIGATEHD